MPISQMGNCRILRTVCRPEAEILSWRTVKEENRRKRKAAAPDLPWEAETARI